MFTIGYIHKLLGGVGDEGDLRLLSWCTENLVSRLFAGFRTSIVLGEHIIFCFIGSWLYLAFVKQLCREVIFRAGVYQYSSLVIV